MVPPSELPIWQVHQELIAVLTRGNRAVLVAPTGSGKTTQIPQMILDAGLAGSGRVVVLQPRRVAARSVAARVAQERRSRLGQEVGYQIRFDDHTSLGTRICFITEGILLRWLQSNRALDGIGALLFDEFHERTLLSDVALALAKHLQQSARPDLRLVVMSATLDAAPVADYLGGCPILESSGRAHPVEIDYLKYQDNRPIPEQAADAVEEILRRGDPGDVLVFMPGMGEIQATLREIDTRRLPEPVLGLPLHGDLPAEEQDRAFLPAPRRKIVVSTNVAETSVTIDGIRFVVDGGLARVARFDPARGLQSLLIEEISRASADQRAGRAGRTAPGKCLRLWTESGHLNRPEKNTPEIQRSDLAEVVLLLHSLGIRQAAKFDWLDRPDTAAVEHAEELLRCLGALDPAPAPAPPDAATADSGPGQGDLTEIGRALLKLPMHPRFARMLVEAARHRCVPAAALCAALVSGRDLLVRLGRDDQLVAEAREVFESGSDSDFIVLIRAYEFARRNRFQLEPCRRYGIHAQTARLVAQTFDQFLNLAKQAGLWTPPEAEPEPGTDEGLARSIMAGFIDQLAKRRDQGSLECDLTGGRSGTLQRSSVVQTSPLLVVAGIREMENRAGRPLTLLSLATAVRIEWIETAFPHLLETREEYIFDRTHKRVAAVRIRSCLGLPLEGAHLREPDPVACGRCLARAAREGLFELPLFNHDVRQWMGRVNLAAAAAPELEIPPFDEQAIVECLARAFHGLTLSKAAQETPVKNAFLAHLPAGQRAWIDELAPLTVSWTDGKTRKLLYSDEPVAPGTPPAAPELQVKIQECFALKEHPRIAESKVPVKLWLCAPDGKRLESTTDWPAFRQSTYLKLKPGLQKKYPSITWV